MLMYLTIIDSKEGQQKFEFIYNRYKKLMFYIANKILGDTRDSEDTVHDAFLKIIEIIFPSSSLAFSVPLYARSLWRFQAMLWNCLIPIRISAFIWRISQMPSVC